jgi:hypothetical protein
MILTTVRHPQYFLEPEKLVTGDSADEKISALEINQ